MTAVEIDLDASGARATVRAELLLRLDGVGRALVPEVRRRSPDDTGELDASYRSEPDAANDRVLVGTPLFHGLIVEIGSASMRPRAPLRRTLDEESAEILNRLARG